MGTRADFYIETDKPAPKTLHWFGSVGWDGYPEGIDSKIFGAKTLPQYVRAVLHFISESQGTFRRDGWPWPWEDSNTTDFSYVFREGKVFGTCFGHGGWWPTKYMKSKDTRKKNWSLDAPRDKDGWLDEGKEKPILFPNMKEIMKIAWDANRSGLMIFSKGKLV